MASEIGDAIDEVRAEMSSAATDILPDTCTISTPGAATVDDYGNSSGGAPATVEGVPCEYTPLSAYEKSVGGGLVSGADHKLRLPVFWEGVALSVPAHSTITVNARGLNPARTFGVTGPLQSSSALFLTVAATLQ